MNGEKRPNMTISWFVKVVIKLFRLKSDSLQTLPDYKNITEDSPDAKLLINLMDEMRFSTHGRGKLYEIEIFYLLKTILRQEPYLHLMQLVQKFKKLHFFQKVQNCQRIGSNIHEHLSRGEPNRSGDEIVAIQDTL